MAEPWLSPGAQLTEFFAPDQLEASARRTKVVQRTSKITGNLFLALVTFALGPTLRATVWQKQHREGSLGKLVRHFQAGAEQWLQLLFQGPQPLTTFLSQACAAAERLVRKAVRNRRTSAQRLRDSLVPIRITRRPGRR